MTFRTTGKLTDFHTFTKVHGTTVQMFSVFDAKTAILTSAIPPIRRQTSTTDIEHLIKLLLRVLSRWLIALHPSKHPNMVCCMVGTPSLVLLTSPGLHTLNSGFWGFCGLGTCGVYGFDSG
jgi:hypothetical protein